MVPDMTLTMHHADGTKTEMPFNHGIVMQRNSGSEPLKLRIDSYEYAARSDEGLFVPTGKYDRFATWSQPFTSYTIG